MRRLHLLTAALLLGVLVAMTAATPATGAPKDTVTWTLECESGRMIAVRGGYSWTFHNLDGTDRFVAHRLVVDDWDGFVVADRALGRDGEICTTVCPYMGVHMTLHGVRTPASGR
jgi:hypothetical protein